MINLRDLEFLASLARRKHFARAAEDCGVSQPAFSMRIRNIEEKLGAAVVKRGNRFQGFTTEGDALVRHARKIMDDFRVMEQEFRSARGEISGTLSIGVIPTANIYAARLIKQLQNRHPGIKVRLQTDTSLAIQQGLEDGRFDAGVTYGEGVALDLYRSTALYEETYLLLAPDRFAPRRQGDISWTEAAEIPLSLLEPGMRNRSIIDRVFSELGLVPKVLAESSGFTASIVLASEGMAATIVPQHLVETFGPLKGTVALSLIDPVLLKEVCLISPARDQNLPTVDALHRLCATHHQE